MTLCLFLFLFWGCFFFGRVGEDNGKGKAKRKQFCEEDAVERGGGGKEDEENE